jgi:hypothetical protein
MDTAKRREPDKEKLFDIFEKLEFGAFIKKYGLDGDNADASLGIHTV